MNAAPLLEFQGVSFAFQGRPTILQELSFTLAAATSTALIGPNGAGKTTLLRLATGALTPVSGHVLLDGRSLADLSRRERARLIALVPQQLTVPFDYTVEQVVEQGRTPYLDFFRGPRRTDREAIDRALALTDLSGLRRRIVNELSGGERQRVKIALGLAQGSRLLLLDEPTQNLDIGRQSELMDLLESLRAEGLTLLTSLHDLHLIPGNFSEVYLLGRGASYQRGTPEMILTEANLRQTFQTNARLYAPFTTSS